MVLEQKCVTSVNYLDQFINDNLEQRFVIQISEKRLKYLKAGNIYSSNATTLFM